MGSQFGKFTYDKVPKSQEDDENHDAVVINDSNSDKEEGGGESKKAMIIGEAPTWKAVANMTSFVQGVGTLALPYAVLKGGIATVIGFPLIALIRWYTGKVMIDCMYDDKDEDEQEEEKDEILKENTPYRQTPAPVKLRVRGEYSDLGKVLWPRYGSALLYVLQSFDLLILAVSYLISCGSLMAHALPEAGLAEATWASIIAVLVLPSTFLKDLACVAWQSLLGVISLTSMVSVLIWFTINNSSDINFKHLLFWDTEGAPVAFGLILSSYCVYSILIPVEGNMADRSRFSSALGGSLLLAAVFKVMFSLCGFLSFVDETDEVIGNNFPLGAPRTIVSITYVIYVVFNYTLVIYPVLQSVDESRLSSAMASYIPWFIWTAITRFSVAFLTLLIAVAIPHFALLTSFVGSLALPFLEYIVPCSVHLKLKWSSLKPLQIAADGSVIVMGVLGTIFGVYFSGKALVIEMTKP